MLSICYEVVTAGFNKLKVLLITDAAKDSRTHQSSDNQQALYTSGTFRTLSTAYVMTAASENLDWTISVEKCSRLQNTSVK